VLAGVTWVVISTAIFGSTPAIVTSFHGDMTMVEVLAFRGLLAALLLWSLSLVARRLRGRGSQGRDLTQGSSRKWLAGLLIGVLLYAPQLVMFYSAFSYLDTSIAVSLGYLYPTMVVCLAALRARRRPSGVDLVLSVTSLVGIFALTASDGHTGGVSATGVYLVFAAALLYAIYVVIAGDLVTQQPPLQIAAQVSLGVGLATTLGALALGQLSVPRGWDTWVALLVQSCLLVAAIGTYYTGLHILGSSRTSVVDTAQPLFAVVAGGLLLGERLVAVQLLGVVIIVASVAAGSAQATRRTAIPLSERP